MKQFLTIFWAFLLGCTQLPAQVITLSSEKPAFNEEITLTFHAKEGNAGLADYEGDVYVHAGLITNESSSATDWKKVVADWGDNENSPQLTRVDANTYELQFTISELYGIPATGGGVVALAFVFRNEDGSKVGKEKGGKDIYFYFQEPDFKAPPEVWEESQTIAPDWAQYATIYEVNIRQYTEEGTINAFAEHLPRLRDLGVDILWFMPVQPIGKEKRKGPLGSYYSIQDYTAVNPEFGTLEDFKRLVHRAHGMGFKVILDWVANHSAWDHDWVSKHPDWYTKDQDGNMIAPYDWTDVADLNYDMYYMRQAMTEAMLFWIQEADIDGFRCDVAGEVPLDFWEDTRARLDREKEIWMIAEDGSQYWLLNQAFNANYGWHFHHLMNQVAKGETAASDLIDHFDDIQRNYPKGTYPMQFITNHDENSWAGTVFERMGDGHEAFAVLSFTVPGMPLMYSGQEAGLNKRLKFFDKDPIDWSDSSLTPFYTRLNDLKAQHPALWNGTAGGWIEPLKNDRPASVVSFSRKKGQDQVVSIINLSPEEQAITLIAGEAAGMYRDFFTNESFRLDKRTQFSLRPWEYRVLILEEKLPDLPRSFQGLENGKTGLRIFTNDGTLLFTPYSEQAIEVAFEPVGSENPPSHAISIPTPEVSTTLEETETSVTYSTSGLDVFINKDPFQVRYHYQGQPLCSEEKGFFDDGETLGFRFLLDEQEKLTGGGERVLGMNRRGHRLQLYNQPSYGYETSAPLMYYSMPVVISSDKYMLVFDNGAKGYIDLGAAEPNVLEFGAVGGRMSYLLVAADEWPDLATHFTEVTGRQPMLPRWALGNITSRMGYHSQQEAEEVVATFFEEDFPLDAIVFDLFWFGPDLKGHLGNLDWYRDSFPEPEKMIQNFKDQGVQTVLITEPFVLENTATYEEVLDNQLVGTTSTGDPYHYDFYFGRTTLLDLFKPETKRWFWDIYKKHTRTGVAGWWGDLGEPEMHPGDMVHVNGLGDEVHNLYGHEWARLIYEGYQKDFPDQRPVILMRSGFVGSQRYGMVPWTGDVNRTWGGLKPQVEIALTMGMQGMGLMHSDLGGFAGDYEDAELYIRWLQYGVFQPVYRTHSQDMVPPEPIYWDEKTKDIVRPYIKLRYRLIPYIYSLLFDNTQTGIPMMRPIFYLEDDPALFDHKEEYLWGDAFLVAPVVEKGATTRQVYLPKGAYWLDFWNNRAYEGGQTIDYPVTLEKLPVFVKAGSFIPMVEPVRNMKEYSTDQLEVHYYHHTQATAGSGFFYDDDGTTKGAFEKGEYDRIDFAAQQKEGTIVMDVLANRKQQRMMHFVLHGLESLPQSVTVDGVAVEAIRKDEGISIPVSMNAQKVRITISL
jgi:oligosaccharide 4-alpha-D-glucosyltransferase